MLGGTVGGLVAAVRVHLVYDAVGLLATPLLYAVVGVLRYPAIDVVRLLGASQLVPVRAGRVVLFCRQVALVRLALTRIGGGLRAYNLKYKKELV